MLGVFALTLKFIGRNRVLILKLKIKIRRRSVVDDVKLNLVQVAVIVVEVVPRVVHRVVLVHQAVPVRAVAVVQVVHHQNRAVPAVIMTGHVQNADQDHQVSGPHQKQKNVKIKRRRRIELRIKRRIRMV